MKNRAIALILILSLISALPCAALAEKSYSGHTSIAYASWAQKENILLAAEALDGLTVERGETFSFNDVVGPRTKARGYLTAENGRGVNVTGGGVAQAATTLYLALLQADDDIYYDELSTYGERFTGDYVSDGDLAVMTDYSSGMDFCFINEESDTQIEMWVSGNTLFCTVTMSNDDDWFDDTDRTLSARIPWGGEEGVRTNIELAAQSIYDTTLSEGDKFSFNSLVGPRTRYYGYVNATNGRGARVVGGGVAQVASVIWLAIKNDDDFTIVEKSTYGNRYNQDYVERASDAIITDYSAGTDFSFRYTGDGTATIYTYIQGGYLHCDIAISD